MVIALQHDPVFRAVKAIVDEAREDGTQNVSNHPYMRVIGLYKSMRDHKVPYDRIELDEETFRVIEPYYHVVPVVGDGV